MSTLRLVAPREVSKLGWGTVEPKYATSNPERRAEGYNGEVGRLELILVVPHGAPGR